MGLTVMRHTFRIDTPPLVKQRPRMTRRGRVYTPQKTLDYERIVASFYDGPRFNGPVALTACFARHYTTVTLSDMDAPTQKLRGDLDNYLKAILDGLNGVAYGDDLQIARLQAYNL